MDDYKDKLVQFNSRIPARLKERFHAKASDQGVGAQDVLARILSEYIDAPQPMREANIKWHRMLETVLNEGTRRDRDGIEANLEWAVNDINRRKADDADSEIVFQKVFVPTPTRAGTKNPVRKIAPRKAG